MFGIDIFLVDGCWKSSSIVFHLRNGYIHFSRPKESREVYPKGTVATFTRRLGFYLSGTRSATCQSTQWSYTGHQPSCLGEYNLVILISQKFVLLLSVGYFKFLPLTSK